MMKKDKFYKTIHKKRGFSLIEALVFISVLAVFIITAIAVTTATLRNLKISEHKILATKYAEELSDWLRGQKEEDTNAFMLKAGTYCFDRTPINGWGSNGLCTAFTGLFPAIYKRRVILSNTSTTPPSINVDILIEWEEAGMTFTVPIKNIFSVYE